MDQAVPAASIVLVVMVVCSSRHVRETANHLHKRSTPDIQWVHFQWTWTSPFRINDHSQSFKWHSPSPFHHIQLWQGWDATCWYESTLWISSGFSWNRNEYVRSKHEGETKASSQIKGILKKGELDTIGAAMGELLGEDSMAADRPTFLKIVPESIWSSNQLQHGFGPTVLVLPLNISCEKISIFSSVTCLTCSCYQQNINI